MGTKRIWALTLGLICISAGLGAQAPEPGFFLVEEGQGNPRFVQRLAWAGGEYALRFEVIIEAAAGPTFREQHREFSYDPYIDVSLPPGFYRFQVIPYDYFDDQDEPSPWQEFTVLEATQPQVEGAPNFAFSRSAGTYVMDLRGSNISPQAEIALHRDGEEALHPLEADISAQGNRARLVFDEEELSPGDYALTIRNPGGLEATRENISFSRRAERTPFFDRFYGGALEPSLWVAYMSLFRSYQGSGDSMDRIFTRNVSPLGAALGLTLLFGDSPPEGAFSALGGIIPGLEAALLWHGLESDQGKHHLLSGRLSLLAQKGLANQRGALRFRLGTGYSFVLSPPEDLETQGMDLLHLRMGASYFFQVHDRIYLDLGLDHMHFFKKEALGAILPWLSVNFSF